MSTPAPCEFLEWDTEFFNRRIARCNGPEGLRGPWRLWCEDNRIDCLYLMVDEADPESCALAESEGFIHVDTRIEMVRDLRNVLPKEALPVREAGPGDLPALQAIARASHHDTRFYADPHFSEEDCARLYETWITRSFEEFADHVLTVDMNGRPAGYVTLDLGRPQSRLGIIAVEESARRQGVGTSLIAGLLRRANAHGATEVTTATQERNADARGLFAGTGFTDSARRRWYHKWFE